MCFVSHWQRRVWDLSWVAVPLQQMGRRETLSKVCEIDITLTGLFSSPFALIIKKNKNIKHFRRDIMEGIEHFHKLCIEMNVTKTKFECPILRNRLSIDPPVNFFWSLSYGLFVDLFFRLSFLVYRTGCLTKDSHDFMSCFIRGYSLKIGSKFVWYAP